MPLTQLSDSAVLFPLLDQFAERYPGIRRPAVVSQWSMNYLSVLLPATLAVSLTQGKAIPAWEHDIELLHDQAQPRALKITPWLPALARNQQADYWDRLIHEHLEPLNATLSQWGGLAPKVLWGNMVAVWDAAFDRLSGSIPREGFAEAHQVLEQMSVAQGRLKLRKLQRQVESPAPDVIAEIPLRTHCCLHYQLHAPVEGKPLVLCEACPKLHRLPIAEQASYLRTIYDVAD